MSKTISRKYIKRVANRDNNISKYSGSSGGNSSGDGTGGVSKYWVKTNFVSRADYEEKVEELEQRIQDLEDRATALEGRATALEGRVSSLESSVSDLDDRVSALEDESTS